MKVLMLAHVLGGASITYRQYGWSMVVSRPPTMPTQA
jgi:hypothetical protein